MIKNTRCRNRLFFIGVTIIAIVTTNSVAMVVSPKLLSNLVDISFNLLDNPPPTVNDHNQVFIAIGGGPGSGKSTVAQSLSTLVNKKAKSDISLVIPMDGYHIPRRELQKMGSSGRIIGDPQATTGTSTSFEDLLARRGAPWTFDCEMFIQDIAKAKRDGEHSFPIYCREKSDPIPDGAILTQNHKLVFCEGNYLLAFDDKEWEPLKNLWDEKWYVTLPNADMMLDRLTDRHLETWTDEKTKLWGVGRDGARAKAEANDLKNAIWIEKVSKHHANLVIENV